MIQTGAVSIIITCHNLGSRVARAINSALSQTYPKFEVVVVNDGSTDNSANVINNYGPRIVSISQENRGLSGARRRGIQEAQGEFILPLDADDWISPDYLAKTVPLMTDVRVGIVATDLQYFGLRGDIIRTKGFTLEVEMASNQLPVCSLIRRRAYDQTPGYVDIENEDWNLWIDILKRGWKVGYVPETLFHYEIRENSLSVQQKNRAAQRRAMVQKQHPELNWK